MKDNMEDKKTEEYLNEILEESKKPTMMGYLASLKICYFRLLQAYSGNKYRIGKVKL